MLTVGSLPLAPARLRRSFATPSAGLCPATPRRGDTSPQTPVNMTTPYSALTKSPLRSMLNRIGFIKTHVVLLRVDSSLVWESRVGSLSNYLEEKPKQCYLEGTIRISKMHAECKVSISHKIRRAK